jgi:prepilin-type processing-associated H-X9-DG protein
MIGTRLLGTHSPTGGSGYRARKAWNPRIARTVYVGNVGLAWGFSWPDFPKGRGVSTGKPYMLAEVSKPALLSMVWHDDIIHSPDFPRDVRLNFCFLDGHARFSHFAGAPWLWNMNNPTRPVDVEKPFARLAPRRPRGADQDVAS